MTQNLVAENGTVVHAPSATKRNPVLCSNMRRASGYEIIEAGFSPTNSPVTCVNCCRILGVEAPKPVAGKKAKPVLDLFEVGQRIVVSRIGETRYGTVTQLTKTWVTYVPEDAPLTTKGKPNTMAFRRTKARLLNP